jgi:hypothetical protein
MTLETLLGRVEQDLQEVSAALLAADAPGLEKSTSSLRTAVVAFAQALEVWRAQQRAQKQGAAQDALPAALQQRIRAASALLAMQRENLARLSAAHGRQLAALLPLASAAETTYEAAVNGRPAGSAARMYRSAG